MAGDRHALCEEDQFILGGCSNPMPFPLAQDLVTTRCKTGGFFVCFLTNRPTYGKVPEIGMPMNL
jgi:hypothetical protein